MVKILKSEREHMRKKRCITVGTPSKILEALSTCLLPTQLVAARYVLKQLSIGRISPFAKVNQSGIVPQLVEFLGREDSAELQLEAAWALTNIASDHTKAVTANGTVPIFVNLLASANDSLCQQAMRALGTIAGDSLECRNLVLQEGALDKLLDQLDDPKDPEMFQNAAWALSNFCRGKPQLSCAQTTSALKSLWKLIRSNDEQVLKDACWALSYLSDGPNDNIQAVIDSDVFPTLVKLLKQCSPSVLIPALRTVGNIATGDDNQTHYIIKHEEVLPRLSELLLNDYDKSIKKEACRTISIITAGNKGHIQKVIDANIIGPLVNLLQNSESDIKKEAAWAISNAIYFGSYTQIEYLVSCGCVEPLCALLICPDPSIVTVCLEGLENILKGGEPQKDMAEPGDVNAYAQMIGELEDFEKIEKLQIHNNTKIRVRATKLLKTYWEEDDDHVTPPGDVDQPGFGYEGANSVPAGIYKRGGTIIGTSRGDYDNQKIVNSIEEENQDNSMGVENRLKIEARLRNLEGRELGRSAGSTKGKPKIEAYNKDLKKGDGAMITPAKTYNASADSVTGEVNEYKKKKKKAVTDEEEAAPEEDAGTKKDKKKKKHASEVAVEVQNEQENVDKKKKKRKHVEVDEAEPEVEKSTKKKDKKKKKTKE